MKKIVPFKKDIIFKNNLSEITSISLEHSLHISNDNLITGEFVVSGDYRMTDSSINTDSFSYNLPFDINMDDHYILDNVEIDIDDFYYEIKDNNILSVNIEVLIDKLEEKKLIEKKIIIEDINSKGDDDVQELFEEKLSSEPELVRNNADIKMESVTEEKIVEDNKKVESEIKSLFDNIDESNETYSTYYIYIVRETDSIETILQKYNVSKEDIEMYNDIKELKVGDKIIIPSVNA